MIGIAQDGNLEIKNIPKCSFLSNGMSILVFMKQDEPLASI
jgi:hypothetical protein